jgi:hypothetical protein
MTYQLFERYRRRAKHQTPVVTIRSGVFSFNISALSLLPEFVVLCWEDDRKMIGFQPSTAEVSNAYKINRKGGNLSAVAFFRHYKITQRGKREARWNTEEKLLEIFTKEESHG